MARGRRGVLDRSLSRMAMAVRAVKPVTAGISQLRLRPQFD
jgi:hypothetical protein